MTTGLATPERIQTLQRKLYLKAKREPGYRFYALYDKVYRADILAHAYALSKANGGAPGVDGVRFEDIEANGRERFLVELRDELRDKRYRAAAVLRVLIPKASGGERPLGIPTIRDRVVQAAASWCWSRSSRRIFPTPPTVTGRAAAPSRRCGRCTRR